MWNCHLFGSKTKPQSVSWCSKLYLWRQLKSMWSGCWHQGEGHSELTKILHEPRRRSFLRAALRLDESVNIKHPWCHSAQRPPLHPADECVNEVLCCLITPSLPWCCPNTLTSHHRTHLTWLVCMTSEWVIFFNFFLLAGMKTLTNLGSLFKIS